MGATIKDSARRGDSNRAGMGAEATGGIGYHSKSQTRSPSSIHPVQRP
jgi:hypothetical protein